MVHTTKIKRNVCPTLTYISFAINACLDEFGSVEHLQDELEQRLEQALSQFQNMGTTYLENSEQGLRKVVECAPFGDRLVKVKLAPEKLHAQQGEDDDEEEEKQ